MENLFSEIEEAEKKISLYIYCDEIKKGKNSIGESWMYLGMLIIPENKKQQAYDKLFQSRKEADYFDELHFTSITNYSYARVHNKKTLLAKNWIDIIKRDAIDKYFYWNVLGINCSNLNFQFFGNDKNKIFQNVYNRFFRCLLKNSFNNFFPDYKIIVRNVFHDIESQLNSHQYFDWHAIYRLSNSMENVFFENGNVVFIDSDHHKELHYKDESHFIQLTDLLLGAFHQVFDNSSGNDGKQEIGKCFGELLNPMIEKQTDIKSKYGYFRKYSFSFFPSKKIKSTDVINSWERISSGFYRKRKLLGIVDEQMSFF